MYAHSLKRILDLLVSGLLLIIASPLLVFLSLVLLLQNWGNPFFTQIRPGKDQQPFRLIKFKTMNDRRDMYGNLLSDRDRLTFTGRWLRKFSLDELPQLINVVKGDMSMVGPRPLLMKYLPLYSEEQNKRHAVRPGITGWAQVNGRNTISWTRKFELDVYYVEHLSFTLDMKILWMTVPKVLKNEGVNQSSTRPMEPFNGSN